MKWISTSMNHRNNHGACAKSPSWVICQDSGGSKHAKSSRYTGRDRKWMNKYSSMRIVPTSGHMETLWDSAETVCDFTAVTSTELNKGAN